MRIATFALPCLALAACTADAPQTDAEPDAEVSISEDDVALGGEPSDSDPRFAKTAWEWQSVEGIEMYTVLDGAGTYRSAGAGELLDQGRWQVRGDQLCFDSEILDDEPGCFIARKYAPLEVGQTWETENGDGETARFTRVPYREIAFLPANS